MENQTTILTIIFLSYCSLSTILFFSYFAIQDKDSISEKVKNTLLYSSTLALVFAPVFLFILVEFKQLYL